MGDVPLGICPLVATIKRRIPEAKITFLIRKDLGPAFTLFPEVSYLVDPTFIRGQPYDITRSHQIDQKKYEVFINWPDPTYWCQSMVGSFVPKLTWPASWDALHKRFDLDPKEEYIGLQPSVSSPHGKWRSWGLEKYAKLITLLEKKHGKKVLLFGSQDERSSDIGGIDLRGKTSIEELFSLIYHRCSHLILPDSGILSILYYIDRPSPLRIVSLWARPLQGVLKQNVPSPNPYLEHIPLIGDYKNLDQISVGATLKAILGETHAPL
ncbi:MAG: glycosyltransferase family 9 protein [Chlamydiota bacterium]